MPPEAEAINLPFREAIAYFRDKLNLPSENWFDIWERAHSKSFTIAGAIKTELLQDLREAIQSALEEGKSIQQFREEFPKIVERYGWAYKGAEGWRTGIIFNTNMTVAYTVGRYRQATDPTILEQFPYWRYRTMDDARVRPEHAKWNNLVLRADDPFWATHYPPNGWGCRCEVQSLTEKQVKRLKDITEVITKAPIIKYSPWTNPKTGEIVQVPQGIDPGWAYNVGAEGSI